jgi:hypothetical protein
MMKKPWLVVYSSLSGNTKSVGEAIFKVLPEGSEIFSVEEAPSAEGYEKVAIGYWVDKGTADAKAMEYLQKTTNAKVFVFATLGAYPDSDHARESLDRGAALLGEGCEVIGKFICQGRLSEAIMERIRQMPKDAPHSASPEREARWKAASTHPDEADFAAVQGAIKEIM